MSKQSIVIIIVVFFFCVISVSLTGLWTCTNGTLKSEDWKWANCLKIPGGDDDEDEDEDEDDGDEDGDGDGNGAGDGNGDGDGDGDEDGDEAEDEYTGCMLNIDSTRTCYNPDQSVGFQWYWPVGSTQCKSDVRKYRIEMTSSRDNHAIVYYYEINSTSANSFAVKGNKDYFEGHSVKVRVIALDSYNQVIARTDEYTLSADGADKSCENQGLSNSREWSEMKHHAGVPLSRNDPTYTPVRIIHVPTSRPVLYSGNMAIMDPDVPYKEDVWYTPNRITDTRELVFKSSDGQTMKKSTQSNWVDVYDRDTEWGYWNIVDGKLQNKEGDNICLSLVGGGASAIWDRLQVDNCNLVGDRGQFKVDFLEKNND